MKVSDNTFVQTTGDARFLGRGGSQMRRDFRQLDLLRVHTCGAELEVLSSLKSLLTPKNVRSGTNLGAMGW